MGSLSYVQFAVDVATIAPSVIILCSSISATALIVLDADESQMVALRISI